jgi:hypothetical protein
MTEKKTRKSAPRPNSGRRGKDGAIGNLVIKNIRFTPEQAEWVTENGPSAVRQLVQNELNKEPSE